MKKFMIRCDVEGVSGVVSYDQAEPGKPEYETGRKWFMSDLTALVKGLVDGGADTGPIILQSPVEVKPGDTPEILQQRVMKTEHQLLPCAVRLMSEDKLAVAGRIVTIKED